MGNAMKGLANVVIDAYVKIKSTIMYLVMDSVTVNGTMIIIFGLVMVIVSQSMINVMVCVMKIIRIVTEDV